MRRRRGYLNGTPTYQTVNPMWTDEETAEHRMRIRMTAEERRQREEEAGEDPFVILGKMVKVASQHIWKKVSQKTNGKDETGDLKQHDEENEGGDTEAESPRSMAGDIPPCDEPRRILATIHSNGKSGQMEHHDNDQFSDVGQTETIVEGHTKYSWVAPKTSTSAQPEG